MLVANYAWGQISEPLAEGLNGSVPSADADKINNAVSDTTNGVAFFDTLLPFLLIGVFGFVMISGGAIMRSPIMIFVGIIVFGVLMTIAVVYSNVYGELIQSDLGSSADNVTIGMLFMEFLPYILIVGIIILVIVTTTNSGATGGQL